MRFLHSLGLFSALLSSALCAAPAHAQSTQPVKLVVGYSAGGPVDAAARLFAPTFSKELGRTVIVENRPGVGGMLAGEMVARAASDGSVLYFAGSPTMTITPHIQKEMGFDPVKDMTPLAPVLSYANVLVVSKDSPFQTVAELIAYARAHPGKLSYGSAGSGASNHLSGELFAVRTRTTLNHIPYKGNAPAMTDLIGGQIMMMFDVIGSATQFLASGRVRALAITSAQRSRSLPNVPTMGESGVPDYAFVGWYGVYGPARMEPALVRRYNEAVTKTLANEDLRTKLMAQGYDLWTGGPQLLAEQQKKDLALWGKVTEGIAGK